MAGFAFKIRVVKEKDWKKERAEYLKKIEVAAQPVRAYIEGLIKDVGSN